MDLPNQDVVSRVNAVYGSTQWANSPKKQSEGVHFC